MKRIVITIAAVVFAAVAAQAQSARAEVMIVDTGFSSLAPRATVSGEKDSASTKQSNLQNNVTRLVARARAAEAKQQANPPKQQATTPKQQAPKRAVTKPAAKKNGQAESTQGSVDAWLKAVFLGGPYPGETSEEYHNRLMAQSQPASLPFK